MLYDKLKADYGDRSAEVSYRYQKRLVHHRVSRTEGWRISWSWRVCMRVCMLFEDWSICRYAISLLTDIKNDDWFFIFA